MSEAWLASRPVSNGVPFAVLKQLLPSLEDQVAARHILQAEGKLLQTLHHPNIVRAYEMAVIDDRLSLPLEFIYGDTLNRVLAQSLRQGVLFPFYLTAYILHAYVGALHYLHVDARQAPLVHGDISPQNLMVSYRGEVKLIDLGVCNAELERGQLIGKPAYTAPEQLLGIASGPPSDIFTLGIVAWELLVGRRLVNVNDSMQAKKRLLHQRIPSPSVLRENVPAELETVVRAMLEINPAHRITAAEAQSKLGRYLQSHPHASQEKTVLSAFMYRYAPQKKRDLDHFFSATLATQSTGEASTLAAPWTLKSRSS